jgi:outer membrane lipoprotein-sorting protein
MPQDTITAALKSYDTVASYRVTLRVMHGNSNDIIQYSFKKPGFVRMDFVKPHKGAVLVYDPAANRVRLQPFGISKAFALSLSPDSRLVKSPSGHQVNESDIGALLRRVLLLQKQGLATVQGEELVGGKATVLVNIVGKDGFSLDATHSFLLNLDAATLLPLQVRTYDVAGKLLEKVLMDDLETDVHFDDHFFTP